ncbi:MAG: hypothetical protein GY834_02365 [Bacteroidetes bacterium]|nr:hypothetical protein [Bacteroidota bacterium]
MKNPFKRNAEVRAQGSLIPTESKTRGNYISNIIKKKYYDYYNINHRKAVCILDPLIAGKLTYGWAKRVTAKTFKFYSSHEVDGKEVMEDVRKLWTELNCNEILRKAIPPMIMDGFVLLDLMLKGKDDEKSLDYEVYGEFESNPNLWARANNLIVGYKVQFTPQPRAIGPGLSNFLNFNNRVSNMMNINKDYAPKELIHVEYGEPNWGLGRPLIEHVWDAVIKLCGESHQEMLDRRSIPTLHLTEDDYDSQHNTAKKILKMVANSDEDTARVWYHKINAQGEILEYPKFAHDSPTSNQDLGSRNANKGISAGQYGNINNEWMRLCSGTGYTVHYFIGNTSGAVVGSETDKTADDENEIIHFGLLEKLIRKILDWLDANELISLPEEPFVIKYWKDWERIELKEKNKEELPFNQPTDDDGNPMPPDANKDVEVDKQDNEPKEEKENKDIVRAIINSFTNNMSYKMTVVSSSWISQLGYYDVTDKLYMKTLSGVVYSKDAPMGEWSFIDWEDAGSKGRYFWDYLSQRDPPWQRDTIPAALNSNTIVKVTGAINQDYELTKIPVLDYELINSLDTEGKIKKLGLSNDWSMGTSTASRIKKMLNSLKDTAMKHQLRNNTMTAQAFGNSIKENYPLMYDIGNGVIVEEFICPESWKKNVGKTVPLGVYHNLDLYDVPELPDWQTVGDAEIFGWDELEGEDYVKYDYDYDKIAAVFNKLEMYDWLTPTLKENGTADISTAYYCDLQIKWNEKQQRFIRVQTNIELISISFVPRGNCPGEVCSIKEIKKNIQQMQAYVKNCISEGMDKGECLSKAYKQFKGVKV